MKDKIIAWIKEKKWYLIGAAAILIVFLAVYVSGCAAGLRCGK